MPGEAMNLRGPCSACGAPLAIDQRYCVECGQRVGPPLALPYTLPAPMVELDRASRPWHAALPMPLQMATTFAALALGFGVVVGTAISPDLAGIVAAPPPSVVAEAPPGTTPLATGGAGGPSSPSSFSGAAIGSTTTGSSTGGGGAGGGGGGGKKKKKKQQQPSKPQTIAGVVVRVNKVAESYTISSGGTLMSIHSGSLPDAGDIVELTAVKLINGTFTEQGARTGNGKTDEATFAGRVSYCADLEQPAEPCDGASPTDHYVYAVSSLGASVLVSAPVPAVGAPPKVGDGVNVTVKIGDPLPPVTPSSWSQNPDCTPPYDEEHGVPDPPLSPHALTQKSVTVTTPDPANSATVEAVLQTVCPGDNRKLVLSADDVRESDRDFAAIEVPDEIKFDKLTVGQAVQADLAIAEDGKLTLRGITSDQGVKGADDPSQGQGTLTGL
jgi:hypothetical protein